MNKPRTMTLTAAAFMACAAGAASAATLTTHQTVAFGPSKTNWTHTFTFTGFNTALGTLTKVTDVITENLTGSIAVTNTSASTGTFDATLTNSAKKTLPSSLIAMATSTGSLSGTLGPGGSTSGAVSGSETGTFSTTSGLAAFEAGAFTAVAMDKGAFSLTGTLAGNLEALFTDEGKITDKLTYTYTTDSTPPATPEPATLTLLGSGLVGLGLARRLRRRRKH